MLIPAQGGQATLGGKESRGKSNPQMVMEMLKKKLS